MENLIGTLGTLLVFGAIIVFHEFGHFIVAKRSGMLVHEFSVGFGPALFAKQVGPTLYALRLIPLGGYVRIAGMEPGEDENTPGGFNTRPFAARFATILAGATMNFVLAAVVLIILGLAVGFPTERTVINGVIPNSPAAQAGIQKGDVIVEIEGTRNPNSGQVAQLIQESPPPVDLVVQRDGREVAFTLTPRRLSQTQRPVIGVEMATISSDFHRLSPVASVKKGVVQVADFTWKTVQGLAMLFTGRASMDQVMGPVGIVSTTHAVAKTALLSAESMYRFLMLFAIISLNIGVVNLLPIPALDGSRLLFLIAEGIRGKPFDRQKEAIVHMVGMVLLLGMIVLITIREVGRLFGGH
jgi:regulator of sigma E protease